MVETKKTTTETFSFFLLTLLFLQYFLSRKIEKNDKRPICQMIEKMADLHRLVWLGLR